MPYFAKDTALTDIMTAWPETIAVFLRYDMLCVGCLVGPFHTLSDACFEHNVDEAEFAQALNGAVIAARALR